MCRFASGVVGYTEPHMLELVLGNQVGALPADAKPTQAYAVFLWVRPSGRVSFKPTTGEPKTVERHADTGQR